jgi:hypothetical protein
MGDALTKVDPQRPCACLAPKRFDDQTPVETACISHLWRFRGGATDLLSTPMLKMYSQETRFARDLINASIGSGEQSTAIPALDASRGAC